MRERFKLHSPFAPAGDQPEAIAQLVDGVRRGDHHQTLLGVTGSGKTFTIANVIEQLQIPTLIISHNKTLAAQLYQEFREFFPENAVEYFVSFYDYYQPEAYIPSSDTYIEKTSQINDEIDRLRLKATTSLLSRSDVLIVASVSCIYNIGSPEAYSDASFGIAVGDTLQRRDFLSRLTGMQYARNDMTLERGTFRVRGDSIEIQPAYDDNALRIETFGDEIEGISRIRVLDGSVITPLERYRIFPAKHYVTTRTSIEEAAQEIYHELEQQLEYLRSKNKLVEAQRLEQRTNYDLEMLRETGFVSGIENYSRILDGRAPGSRPWSLIDFFSRPFLTVIDESHVTLPQIQGMYNGDHARKSTLVEHGFRLPCALDNRPLTFDEFAGQIDNTIYVSATPADYELKASGGIFAEQLIRPTGLVDPPIEIRPATNQVDNLIDELRTVVEKGDRALVITLTKRMSEDLTEYLETLDFKVRYLHSEIDTLERTEILADLRKGTFDILIGINLLREGLDLPEVTLVAILDADKEGFLRSARSLIQIAGRAARNAEGRIILYADTITDSIRKAMTESSRRREKQLEHNEKEGIIPMTIRREIREDVSPYRHNKGELLRAAEKRPAYGTKKGAAATDIFSIDELRHQMAEAAAALEFEKAARLRDRIVELQGHL